MRPNKAERAFRVVGPDGPQDERFGRAGERLLVVEAVHLLPAQVLTDPFRPVILAQYRTLDRAFLGRATPDVIATPLFGRSFDVLDVADRLLGWGFGGRLVAVTPPLPNPGAVLAELRGHCPGLQIDIVELPDPAAPRSARPQLRQVLG